LNLECYANDLKLRGIDLIYFDDIKGIISEFSVRIRRTLKRFEAFCTLWCI